MNLEKEKIIMEICTDNEKISGRKLKAKIMEVLFNGLLQDLANRKTIRSSVPLNPIVGNSEYSINKALNK